jgi:peptide/nickel transport system substrate-binding protein
MDRIPDVLTDLAILPRHLFRGVPRGELRRAPWNERPVGNGPFRFVAHEAGRRWVFAADSGLPAALGRPAISRLVIAVVDEPTTKLAALASGELDFAGIQPAHADFVRRDPRLTVLDYPLLLSYVVVFNARRPPFDRLEARRAVSLAIDRRAIVSGYLFGFATPAGAPLPDTTPPLYAPGRGRALLGSTPLQFELLTVGSGEAAMEQMIQQQLARIGVTVRIRQLELSAFLERLRGPGHGFDAAILGVSGALDPGYLRSLLDLTGVTLPGGTAGLIRGFADSLPVAFLYHARGIQGMNRRMEGVRMDLRGELAGLGAWRTR